MSYKKKLKNLKIKTNHLLENKSFKKPERKDDDGKGSNPRLHGKKNNNV